MTDAPRLALSREEALATLDGRPEPWPSNRSLAREWRVPEATARRWINQWRASRDASPASEPTMAKNGSEGDAPAPETHVAVTHPTDNIVTHPKFLGKQPSDAGQSASLSAPRATLFRPTTPREDAAIVRLVEGFASPASLPVVTQEPSASLPNDAPQLPASQPTVTLQPKRLHFGWAALGVVLFAFGCVVLYAHTENAISLLIERASGDDRSQRAFAIIAVCASVGGALFAWTAEHLKEWRWRCYLTAVVCMTFSFIMALGNNAHRHESAVGARGHDAKLYSELTNEVERLKAERERLSTPITIPQQAKGLPRCLTPECFRERRAADAAVKSAKDQEAARVKALEAVQADYEVKLAEWRKAKPVVSADPAAEGVASFLGFLSVEGAQKLNWGLLTLLPEFLALMAFAASSCTFGKAWRRA